MAYLASTANNKIDTARSKGDMTAVKCGIAQAFKEGDIVVIDRSDGYAYKLNGITLAATDLFAGIAAETKLTGSAVGDLLRVFKRGTFTLGGNGSSTNALVQLDTGAEVYADISAIGGDQVVATTTGSHTPKVGLIVEVVTLGTFANGGRVRVNIDGYAMATNGIAA